MKRFLALLTLLALWPAIALAQTQIDLTNQVQKVLPAANGGTGASSLGTSGQALYDNGGAVGGFGNWSGSQFSIGSTATYTLTLEGNGSMTGNVNLIGPPSQPGAGFLYLDGLGNMSTLATLGSSYLATANKTIDKSVNVLSPTTSLTNLIQYYYARAVTLTRVACSTDAGTVTIQLDTRAEGTPNTAGTDLMSAALACSTSTATTTSFAVSGVTADVPVNLQITATSGSPGVVRIHVDATIN